MSRSNSPAPVRVLDDTDPVIDNNMENNNPDDPALSEQDWKYMQVFQARLAKDVMEYCSRCKESWFNTGVASKVCKKCRTSRDKSKKDDEPFLMSDENHMDPKAFPLNLPKLSQVEEMLIAKVHTFVEVHQVRGQQYKYSGHVCNFLRDVGKVYDKLPLLPKDLEIILLKPANTSDNHGLSRQFRKDYKVRRSPVAIWLEHLKQNHPGYRDIKIDRAALAQLPENGDVQDQIVVQETAAVDEDVDTDHLELGEEEREVAAIPDLIANHSELEQMQREAGVAAGVQAVAPHLTQPAFRSTPLNEFNRSQALLSLAFPTLFPTGEAEFVTPRLRHVSYADYIEHLMKYHDGRFARHPRFRYVVFNTLMRRQVNKKSTYFVNKLSSDDELDVSAIKAAFVTPNDPQAQKLLTSIVRYSASLRGTRPFWNGKRANLETYVRSIGSPSVFKTFSAADYHWDSLHRAYSPQIYTLWKNGTYAERMHITREYLRDNPHIAAYHFHRRFMAIMECIIKPKFGVEDWWNRYEFQSRGSSHNHGFIWVKDAPSLDVEDGVSRQRFAEYWGKHVSAVLPLNVDHALEERTPMSLAPEADENTLRQLDMLVNILQRHLCTDGYCLRVKKGAPADSEKFCRFWSPWELLEEPVVDKSRNPLHWMFLAIRNDDRINSYNRLITMAWKANTDFTPCTGSKAVLNYLGKYCTKEEKKSTTYVDLIKVVLPYINSEKPLLSLVSKTMNKLIGERDWSSQEVFHILFNIPLQIGSREVITLDCRPNQDNQAIRFEDGEVVAQGTSKLQKYIDRPVELEDMTYFAFLTLYSSKYTLRPRAKPRLISYFPTYDAEKNPQDFARVKLMLHHPFRDVSKLLSTADHDILDWTAALNHCSTHHVGNNAHPDFDSDGFGDLPEIVEEDDEFELYEDRQENDLFWAELAAQRPGRDNADLEDPDALGNRDVDRAFDWTEFVDKHPTLTLTWLADNKELHPKSLEVDYVSQSMVETLALKQRQIYDISMGQAGRRARGENPAQLLFQVDGKAGTGKSYTIQLLSAHLQQEFPPNPVQRAAPTGVASHGILGRTLHSLFRLPTGTTTLPPLSPSSLRSLQATLKDLTHLIIDEKSMMSLLILSFLDQRLRQIFAENADQPFGGIDVSLWGDFFQLPPVRATALYNDSHLFNQYDVAGQALYKLFNRTVELELNMRQQGDDIEQQQFRVALEGLRSNNVTQADWKLLISRVQCNISAVEVATFETALRVYGKKKEVNAYNHVKMRDLDAPVKQIKARNTGTGANAASYDQGANLHKILPLCVGARVMLTDNSWTERGLVNGALGTVRSFHWAEGENIETAIPTILVAFDNYDGPVLFENTVEGDQYYRVVPIASVKREFTLANVACTRTQLPLTVAWAITIHKAQGITKDKIVTNVAEKDHVVGLTYVAVSRVKTLKGLLFEEPFDYNRFQMAPSKTETMRLADYARRLPHHVPLAIPELD